MALPCRKSLEYLFSSLAMASNLLKTNLEAPSIRLRMPLCSVVGQSLREKVWLAYLVMRRSLLLGPRKERKGLGGGRGGGRRCCS